MISVKDLGIGCRAEGCGKIKWCSEGWCIKHHPPGDCADHPRAKAPPPATKEPPLVYFSHELCYAIVEYVEASIAGRSPRLKERDAVTRAIVDLATLLAAPADAAPENAEPGRTRSHGSAVNWPALADLVLPKPP